MRSAVVLFPGSNRDRDVVAALTKVTGQAPTVVWHQDTTVPDVEVSPVDGEVTLGGRVLACEPVAEVPLSRRYLLA